MATTILSVPDISCEHCERTILGALQPVAGIQTVHVDIPARQVRVDYDPAAIDVQQMKAVLAEEDYPVADAGSEYAMAEATRASATTVKDLVCGMDVDPATATQRSEYEGTAYFFCGPGCKQAFMANPQQHVK